MKCPSKLSANTLGVTSNLNSQRKTEQNVWPWASLRNDQGWPLGKDYTDDAS